MKKRNQIKDPFIGGLIATLQRELNSRRYTFDSPKPEILKRIYLNLSYGLSKAEDEET